MPKLEVYSRQGCHLCEQLIEQLLPLVRGHFDVDVRDIDSRDDWQRAYQVRVPVVEFRGRLVCEHYLDPVAIGKLIAEQAGQEQ